MGHERPGLGPVLELLHPEHGPAISAIEVLSERPVLTVVMEQLPYTLALIAAGIGWSVAHRHSPGLLGRDQRRGEPMADRIVGVLSVAVIAMPSFVIAIYALLVFAVGLALAARHRCG